jgi:hypothetical protein
VHVRQERAKTVFLLGTGNEFIGTSRRQFVAVWQGGCAGNEAVGCREDNRTAAVATSRLAKTLEDLASTKRRCRVVAKDDDPA